MYQTRLKSYNFKFDKRSIWTESWILKSIGNQKYFTGIVKLFETMTFYKRKKKSRSNEMIIVLTDPLS